ncbi:zinc ribbon domain-containing protein [Gorillibacterium massiliense]|uniref:zinc ribbon domain-containing protein n=1 Tax=Gorillibacterium massiliense TaxID=1280390 RepID=UPI0005940480|nr:zinc ribbon domain-containing protein [Gorillibacterium massiliense]
MECTHCGYLNQGGNFCIKCGTRFEKTPAADSAMRSEGIEAVDGPVTVGVPAGELGTDKPWSASEVQVQPQPNVANDIVQTVKEGAVTYLHFVRDALRKPAAVGMSASRGTFTNAVITFVLFSILTPLFTFSLLKQVISGIQGIFEVKVSFGTVVARPAVFYALFLFLVALIIMGVLYLGKVQITYKQAVARFGALLVIPTVLMAAAIVISLLHANFFLKVASSLSGLGMLGVLIAIVITAYSFKRNSEGGLDSFYVVLLTFVGIGIVLSLFGNYMVHSFINSMQDTFGVNF